MAMALILQLLLGFNPTPACTAPGGCLRSASTCTNSEIIAKFGRIGIQIAFAQALLVPRAEQSRAKRNKLRSSSTAGGGADPTHDAKQAKRKAGAHLSGRDGAEDLHSGEPSRDPDPPSLPADAAGHRSAQIQGRLTDREGGDVRAAQ